MTPAFQSRWPFRKGLGRHRTRFQPVRAGSRRTIPGLIGIPQSQNFQNRGRVAKVGLGTAERRYLGAPAEWMPELLRHRYVRLCDFRHRHMAAQQLISTLAGAIDAAGEQHRDIVLAELSAEPIVPAPPVKPLTRGRPSPHRCSRGL
jgi:hypothetical protein